MKRSHLLPLTGLALFGLAAALAQCGGPAAVGSMAAAPAAAPTQDPKPLAPLPPEGDRLRLLVSGAMSGRLEPCGCASGQLGGLARRMQHIGEQRAYDVLIEGGDLVESATELDVQKMFTATQVLFGMQHPYDALGVGPYDLALPIGEWTAYLAGVPVVASDLTSTLPEWPGKPFREKEVRGMKVRIASFVLAVPDHLKGPESPVRLLPPADGWRAALAGADPTTLRVLLVHATDAVARGLVPKLAPPPDLVVCIDHGYVEPSSRPELVGGVPLVFSGIRGRVLLDISLMRLPTGPRAACDLVPLAGSKTVAGGGGDPDVKQVLLAHREQVKQDGILARMARQLPAPGGAAYVGNENCRSCHPTAFEVWEKSRHFQAWDTLVKAEADPKRYGWPVTHYPDCVSCHVVGYREQTGFVSYEETPQLAAVGCERCHGPGSEHLASGGKKRMGIHSGTAASVLCSQCHDFEQSPDFLYTNKWPLIQHALEPHQQKK